MAEDHSGENGFKLDAKEFEGFVRASLGFIQDDVKEIKTKMSALEKCVWGIKVKTWAIGGTVSLIITLVVLLLNKHI